MSEALVTFAKNFLHSNSDPLVFSEEFIHQWKRERDIGIFVADDPKISEVLSSIFCLADLFNPDVDRETYEIDERKLRDEIERLMRHALIL